MTIEINSVQFRKTQYKEIFFFHCKGIGWKYAITDESKPSLSDQCGVWYPSKDTLLADLPNQLFRIR